MVAAAETASEREISAAIQVVVWSGGYLSLVWAHLRMERTAELERNVRPSRCVHSERYNNKLVVAIKLKYWATWSNEYYILLS